MTFEQRIERLTERHEALAQTVESITIDIRELAKIAQATHTSINQLANSVDALLHVTESHERRITRLEGGVESENN
jgi:archaellum component FlaC